MVILFQMLKKFGKSVKIWQSYGREFLAYFFLAHPVYIYSAFSFLSLFDQY